MFYLQTALFKSWAVVMVFKWEQKILQVPRLFNFQLHINFLDFYLVEYYVIKIYILLIKRN